MAMFEYFDDVRVRGAPPECGYKRLWALSSGSLDARENPDSYLFRYRAGKKFAPLDNGADSIFVTSHLDVTSNGKPFVSMSGGFVKNRPVHDISQRLRWGRTVDQTMMEDLGPVAWFDQETYDRFYDCLDQLSEGGRDMVLSVLEEAVIGGERPDLAALDGTIRSKAFMDIANEWSGLYPRAKRNVEEIVHKILCRPFPNQALMSVPMYLNNNRGSEWTGVVARLPFRPVITPAISISEFEKRIEETHLGMRDVKRVMMEEAAYINRGLRSDSTICLIGAPGTGKTTIAKSFAEATGRPFFVIPMGGSAGDASILMGFHPTWSGAIPGAIIKGIIQCGASNPIIVLDELDKITRRDGKSEGVSSALLSILDPSQQREFVDNYLGFPYDLSGVTFMATANYIDRIAPELQDRLRMVQVPSYSYRDKVRIGTEMILPRLCRNAGISPEESGISEGAIRRIVSEHTRESGCRSLAKSIDRLVRNGVLAAARSNGRFMFEENSIEEVLGKPITSRIKPARVGRMNGLYASVMGGGVLPIEAAISPVGPQDHGNDITRKGEGTGNLRLVMMESISVARSAVLCGAERYGISDPREVSLAHVHAPSGATPKDGPSAGVAICLALISAATRRAPSDGIAVTGEVNLGGDVMPVGGIREKVIGAIQEGIRHIIIPAENEPDVMRIDPLDREGVKFSFVSHIDEAVRHTFVAVSGKEADEEAAI